MTAAWMIPPTGNRLHHVTNPAGNTLNATGSLTACGRVIAGLSVPGRFSAELCVRCAACVRNRPEATLDGQTRSGGTR